MNIVRKILPNEEYYQDIQKKDLIVIHHTAGKNPFDWWIYDKGTKKIATAFSIEQDGTIFQHFDDDAMWAWHIGLKIPLPKPIELRSIGIELVSMGGLNYHPDGKYYDCNGNVFTGQVDSFIQPYRDYMFFEKYTEAQIKSCKELTAYLIEKHNIPKDSPNEAWKLNKFYKSYTGIVHHAQLRPDKSDLHPGFPWNDFCSSLGISRVD